MKLRTILTTLAAILLTALAAWGLQAATRAIRARTSPSPAMAAMLPQGALLTIESPDFATLLASWNSSPEQKAWLTSANFSVFSNSRLFGRLNDARTEFAATASKGDNTLGIDSDFLTQIAGRQSIFAWYDVGKLEFLYITRLTPAQAAASSLMKQRASFTTRQAGDTTFYLRRSTDPESGATRTVAFAQVASAGSTLLLLATREDLMANALELINTPATAQSVTQEPWYAEATAALPTSSTPPILHMVLNLQRIVPLAAFRTYWVQQNITQMKQYRAAASDLYRDSSPAGPVFREERVILPAATLDAPADSPVPALAALVPPATGVFRALATQDAATAVAALQEKLFGTPATADLPATDAPDPSLTAPASGSSTDLETYIDTPAPVSVSASSQALLQTLESTGLDAILTTSTAQPPATPAGLWIPIHSAVVLHATSSWKPEPVITALQQSLRGTLTAATIGIQFRPVAVSGETVYALTGPRPLFFAVHGPLLLLADDQPMLLALLKQAAQPSPTPSSTIQLAGFDHTSQRPPYQRLTSLIDGTNRKPTAAAAADPATPAFFSQNIDSLSNVFAALASQRFEERRDGPNLHQTVIYQWQRP